MTRLHKRLNHSQICLQFPIRRNSAWIQSTTTWYSNSEFNSNCTFTTGDVIELIARIFWWVLIFVGTTLPIEDISTGSWRDALRHEYWSFLFLVLFFFYLWPILIRRLRFRVRFLSFCWGFILFVWKIFCIE